MKTTDKTLTFKFFDYKWKRVPEWARKTDHLYEAWYVTRYGYKNIAGLKKFLSDKQMLCEAGCGVARDSVMFARANPRAKIIAVDQSPHALRASARALAPFPHATTLRADITSFKAPHSFDFISCDQVIHHTPDPGKTLAHLFKKLNPGGVLNFSVCRKKNPMRDLVDDALMNRGRDMTPAELWKFSRVVTHFAKALYDLNIPNVTFGRKRYPSLQRFVHDNVFRAWYNPTIPFELSVSSNYDWFSSNPRFNAQEVRTKILGKISGYKLIRFYEDDATISVSLMKPLTGGRRRK